MILVLKKFTKISKVIENPSQYPAHLSIIKGTLNGSNNSLKVKANNREYISRSTNKN